MKTTLCMNNRRSINQTTFLIHSSYSYYFFLKDLLTGFFFRDKVFDKVIII